MGADWAPVAFTAIIVFGIVGGVLANTFFKRIIPLLETLARDRAAASPQALESVKDRLAELSERISHLEGKDRRLGRIEEEVKFLQELLEHRQEKNRLPPGGA